MTVHPTALVDPSAQLAEGVEIGPYAIIGSRVSLAEGCRVFAHAVLEQDIVAGPGNTFGYGAIIGAPPQDLSFRPNDPARVVIGTGNTFREYTTIHRGMGEGTILGDNNFLMAGAHLAHNVRLGNNILIANNCLLGGHVQVGDRAFLGGGSVYHQFTRIGRLVITQGQGGYGKDIPPFCMAAGINRIAGLNVIGLRRAGFTPAQRAEISAAFSLLYRRGLNVTQALEAASGISTPLAREFFDFVAASTKRGICRLEKRFHNLASD